MKPVIKSIRTFIGAKDFELSRGFYREWGFQETMASAKLCYYSSDNIGFYLQDHYKKYWVENTMIFLEVSDLTEYWDLLKAKELDQKYPGVKLVGPTSFDWGVEAFIYDPSAVLWHIGEFIK